MAQQYMVLDINKFDLSDCESSDHYQRVEDMVQLPANVTVRSEITAADLAEGLANVRPVQL